MRGAVAHHDVLFVIRLEQVEVTLKLVVLLDKQEVPGVPMTPEWMRSFPLYLLVLVERLPQINLPLVRLHFPSLAWGPWGATVSWLGTFLQSA